MLTLACGLLSVELETWSAEDTVLFPAFSSLHALLSGVGRAQDK